MKFITIIHNSHAISEIVGSAILLLIAVLSFSAIYLYVFPLPGYTADTNVDIQGSVSGKYAELFHLGGEPLKEYQIFVDGEPYGDKRYNWKTGDPPIIFEMDKRKIEVMIVTPTEDGGTRIIFEGELETGEQCDFENPEIIDNSESEGTTGDPFEFNIYVNDTSDVFVYVNWSHGTKEENTSLHRIGTSDNFSATVITNHDLSDLIYFIYVKDYWDNSVKTSNKSVTISDNDPPEINLNIPLNNGEYYNISAQITDNIKVQTALINITFPNSSFYEGDLIRTESTYYETFNFTDDGDYIYQVKACDESNNQNNTSNTLTISVLGNSPPSQDSPELYSSLSSNTAGEDLICRNGTTYETDLEDIVTSIYTWYRNNNSFAELYYPFNTNSSNVVKDYTNPQHNGSLSTLTWIADAKVAGGYEFDGSGFIESSLPTVFSDISNNDFSITIWINSDDISSDFNCLLEAFYNVNNYVQIFQYDGRIYAGICENNNKHVVKSIPLSSDNWYHIGLLWDSTSKTARLFVNGFEYTDTGSVSVFTSGDESILCLGQKTDDSNGWNGILDEFYLYDHLVSEDHVYQQFLCTRDGDSTVSVMVSEETTVSDSWYCVVTPNDSFQDGKGKIDVEIEIV